MPPKAWLEVVCQGTRGVDRFMRRPHNKPSDDWRGRNLPDCSPG
jgi:hypothetical protein